MALFLYSHSLELGVIPSHDLSLYDLSEANQKILNINTTYYADYEAKLSISKYFYIAGGMTAYMLNETATAFYPFRVDFQAGAGARYKAFEIGIAHGCYHPICPDETKLPLPNINSAQTRFFVKISK